MDKNKKHDDDNFKKIHKPKKESRHNRKTKLKEVAEAHLYASAEDIEIFEEFYEN